MDMISIRRHVLMAKIKEETWDYVYEKANKSDIWFLDVVVGHMITVQWESPKDIAQNQNAWVINGNGCCGNIKQIRNVGDNGKTTLPITASGQILIGGYSYSNTYMMVGGSIIRIRIK